MTIKSTKMNLGNKVEWLGSLKVEKKIIVHYGQMAKNAQKVVIVDIFVLCSVNLNILFCDPKITCFNRNEKISQKLES